MDWLWMLIELNFFFQNASLTLQPNVKDQNLNAVITDYRYKNSLWQNMPNLKTVKELV